MPKTANVSRFTSWEKMRKCKDDWICLTVLLRETLYSNYKDCCISITATGGHLKWLLRSWMIMDTQVDYRIKISGKAPLKEDKCRFNAPSVSEEAIMIAGELGDCRDIVLYSRSCSQILLQRIQDTRRSYDTLPYLLLFVIGEDGYDLNIKDLNKDTSNNYYTYRMMQRLNEFNTLLRFPRLFQQYIIHMYAKVENERLRFIRLNETKLRAEDYGVLLEAIRNDNNVTSKNLGKLVVLSSSCTGGPRYMHEYA
ncbi:helitron_like_N domain-containing protein [Trichonephila clavipes]|nr:helitron_like_N domain-containing protein [Trichonephila clavipes]